MSYPRVTRRRSRPRFKPKTDDPVKTPQFLLKGFVKIDQTVAQTERAVSWDRRGLRQSANPRRIVRELQQLVFGASDQDPPSIHLALAPQPLLVGHEGCPDALALGHRI